MSRSLSDRERAHDLFIWHLRRELNADSNVGCTYHHLARETPEVHEFKCRNPKQAARIRSFFAKLYEPSLRQSRFSQFRYEKTADQGFRVVAARDIARWSIVSKLYGECGVLLGKDALKRMTFRRKFALIERREVRRFKYQKTVRTVRQLFGPLAMLNHKCRKHANVRAIEKFGRCETICDVQKGEELSLCYDEGAYVCSDCVKGVPENCL